jgi:hypothetical protein
VKELWLEVDCRACYCIESAVRVMFFHGSWAYRWMEACEDAANKRASGSRGVQTGHDVACFDDSVLLVAYVLDLEELKWRSRP